MGGGALSVHSTTPWRLARVLGEQSVMGPFVALRSEHASAGEVGMPTEPSTAMGPLINRASVQRYQRAAIEASRDGEIVTGGERVRNAGLEFGYFVSPTV